MAARLSLGLALVLFAVPASAHAATFGAVGGVRDPAAGVLDLTVQAVETDGVGLRRATAVLEGQVVDTMEFGDGACVPNECPSVGSVDLAVPTTAVPDGSRRLQVTVEDANGTVTHVLDRMLVIANTPIKSNPTVVVQVGGGATTPRPGPPGPPGPGPGPGKGGCASPRLTMMLAQRPLGFRRGVPLLKAGKRYRFRGRLTCIVNGRRRPAERGTLVAVRDRVRGRTISRAPARVRGDGRIVARIAHRRSCTVVFRIRGAGGRLVSVRIPIKVKRT